MVRTVNYRGGEQLVVPYPLGKITSSHNPRHPIPRLQRQGIVPLDFIHSHALSDDVTLNFAFVSALVAYEPEIVHLFLSIDGKGQIEPAILRGYRSAVGTDENGKVYEERAGFICGERRGLACALGEAVRRVVQSQGKKAGETVTFGDNDKVHWDYVVSENCASNKPYTLDAIVLARITVEEAHELALDENDQRKDMTDLDWGREFDRLLKTQNPKTSKPWTIKDIAEKHRRPYHHTDKAAYHWVRTRAALPYLPDEWQAAIEADNGKVNIVKASTYALKCKARVLGKVTVEEGEVAPVIPDLGTADGHKVGLEAPSGPVPAEGTEPTLASAVKTRKRKNPLSRTEIEALFDATPATQHVRRETLAEVLQISLKKAEADSERRKEAREAKKPRKRSA